MVMVAMENNWEQEFSDVFGKRVSFGVPMKDFTTYRIGGRAWAMVFAESADDIRKAVMLCNKSKIGLFPLGYGSNILCADNGYRGAVINLAKSYGAFSWDLHNDKYIVRAEAGASLPQMVRRLGEKGIGGIEFVSGIPGTIGGAVFGNAGAYGNSIMEHVSALDIISLNGAASRLEKEEIAYGYRYTGLPAGAVIEAVELTLFAVDSAESKRKTEKFINERRLKQPLGTFTAGSVFKNPEGYTAGKLIDDAGLKGLKAGGAMISPKHANFIVNAGNATARDVWELINITREKVLKETGVALELEIKIMGNIFS